MRGVSGEAEGGSLSELPSPLVPVEVDLRDFTFMPLDVARLRDSDLASDETPEACWAAVLLWCASWHQVPAGSIPDNDQWQAKQCGYLSQGKIAPAWKRIKTGALRGWVACSDGRRYHPVVAEKANEAWRQKLAQRWRSECARIKKHNQRHQTAVQLPEFEVWIAANCPQGQPLFVPEDTAPMSTGQTGLVPRETPSKRPDQTGTGPDRTGQGPDKGKDEDPPSPSPAPPPPAAAAAAPEPKPDRGARLPKDWALPKAWGEWAIAKYPHWPADTVRLIADSFRNHWTAKTGKDATKLDWFATWQNWCTGDITQRQYPAPRGKPHAVDTANRNAEAKRLLGFTVTTPEEIPHA